MYYQYITCTRIHCIILQLKINHISSCNDCEFILVVGVDANDYYLKNWLFKFLKSLKPLQEMEISNKIPLNPPKGFKF